MNSSETTNPVDDNLMVRSQIIPLDSGLLILPNTAIAEVIGYNPPTDADSDAPSWLLGSIIWRELHIPLISFEVACGLLEIPPSTGKSARIVVLNTVTGSDRIPFYAIVVQGLPRLAALDKNNTQDAPEQFELRPFELRQVLVDGNVAAIPDQEKLESSLSLLGITVDNPEMKAE